MKYYEVEFSINSQCTMHNAQLISDARDLLAALVGETGFETFEETETGLKGYVQQTLFSEEALKEAIADFPFDGITITYDIREAEDRDWNEQWEQEGFEPIIISDGALVIHDGRHLPEIKSGISIEIDAHLAFGTGTHETTRMVCSTLLSLSHLLTSSPSHLLTSSLSHLLTTSPSRVLDCGTGTGILSICALKLGATEAVGYDIDEWSVDNARHNAVINHVDDRFTSLLGDASILLNKVEGTFDLVMANINRNILLADMPLFRQKMAPDAHLILSGFYTSDIPMLADKAATLGLHVIQKKADHDWACLVLKLS
ncbi:MAG: 50S ribosomal protein L11 methyltransferase [Prevotella sp.]|nr:50S ribosomal protein L11 methyltransferase [Prevotella sp.]